MDESTNKNLFSDSFRAELKEILREVLREEIAQILNGEDRLLTVDDAATSLGVSADWLYRNARKLPFSRKLGRKILRFSSRGIQKYLLTRKPA